MKIVIDDRYDSLKELIIYPVNDTIVLLSIKNPNLKTSEITINKGELLQAVKAL